MIQSVNSSHGPNKYGGENTPPAPLQEWVYLLSYYRQSRFIYYVGGAKKLGFLDVHLGTAAAL